MLVKVSEITAKDVAGYLRIDEGQEDESIRFLDILNAAKSYVSSYTGLPVEADTGECLDSYEDITLAVLVVCRELYDNRTLYAEKTNANKVIESILNMHCTNLL